MSDAWVHPFLALLAKTGSQSKSAAGAGISTSTVASRRKTDGDFAAAYAQALEDHTDVCEEELTRRAFGYDEPVVYQGQLTPVWARGADGREITEPYTSRELVDGTWTDVPRQRPVQARNPDGSLQWLTVRKFSDTLLLARVKAYRKQYSTDRTEITGADGGDLKVQDSTARAARVAFLMSQAKGRKEGEGLA